MRKTAKRGLANLLVTLILAALLNLLIFAAMRPWGLAEACRLPFWFSYGALMLAFVLRTVSLYLGRGDASDRRVHTGLPLAVAALLYWGVTLVLSFLYMILCACGVRVPFALPLITLLFTLGFYLIALVLYLAARPEPCTVSPDSALRPIVDRLRALQGEVKDPILVKKLGKLADDLSGAAPSAEHTAGLTSCLGQLEERVAADDRLGITRAIAAMRAYLPH